MARLLSIDISFQNQIYPALVSVRTQGQELSCIVRYIDKRLEYILPGDVLVFSLSEGLKQPHHLPTALAEELMVCTSKAVSLYLQA